MATIEPGIASPASPRDVGRHLRAVRKAKGLSRSEVARSAGLTRRELAAYERGRIPVPESDLWCLAGSCGVDIAELLPGRDRLPTGSDLAALTVGESVARLRAGTGHDNVLREYLAMLYELRNLPPGSRPPMRDEDLAVLADALGGTPEAIEARLHELIGASREEAARLRGMILPPRALTDGTNPSALVPPPAAGSPEPVVAREPAAAVPTAFAPPAFAFASPAAAIGDPAAADRFFDGPRAEDPFAAPPPLDALGALPPLGGFEAAPAAVSAPGVPDAGIPVLPPPAAAPVTFDPFAARDSAGPASYAPPTGSPLAPPLAPQWSADPWSPTAPAARPDLGCDPAPDLDPALDLFPDPAATATAGSAGTVYPALESDFWDGGDSFDGLEMVVLQPPDDEAVDDPLTGSVGGAAPADDPFAILRVPLPDAPLDDPVGPGGDVAFVDAWSVERPAGEVAPADPGYDVPPLDPFADAYTIVDDEDPAARADVEPLGATERRDATDAVAAVDTTTAAAVAEPVAHDDGDAMPDAGADDEPTDEWFDRAAAAAAALVAEARSPDGPGPTAAPVADGPGRDRPDEVSLPPITWSLDPPTPGPHGPAHEPCAPANPEGVADPAFVAAGTDWQVGGIFPATAMADDGALALRRADVRWALADLVASGDFTLRATVDFTSGAGFGILFRVETDDSERITGYSFDVDPIYSGGGFLLRQWNDGRQHWKPLAHAPVADSTRLYGHHTLEVSLRADNLVARVDGEIVMTVQGLSRRSIDSGREPCRGPRVGVQAWSTTEVTVDRLLLASH